MNTTIIAEVTHTEIDGSTTDAYSIGAQVPPTSQDQRLARVIWSHLAEPGDQVANYLITGHGAHDALRILTAEDAEQHIIDLARTHDHLMTRQEAQSAVARLTNRYTIEEATTRAQTDLQTATANGYTLLIPGDEAWPTQLDDLGNTTPYLLWVAGNPALLRTDALTISGARAATGYGLHVTAELIEALKDEARTIIAGAAYGIDAAAHRAAFANKTLTIAVTASGLDRPYPAAHDKLLEQIAKQGAVCSELPFGHAPTRFRFLQRNRILAALSQATIVTEAGTHSGALNTAAWAHSLGRTVGAVPGAITSATSDGCHRLIRTLDAALITNAEDIRAILG